MILIEYALKFIVCLFYIPARFLVWVVTARDCKRCENYNGYYCCSFDDDICLKTPHRCRFKRERWFV